MDTRYGTQRTHASVQQPEKHKYAFNSSQLVWVDVSALKMYTAKGIRRSVYSNLSVNNVLLLPLRLLLSGSILVLNFFFLYLQLNACIT